jgi:hypothetical protein
MGDPVPTEDGPATLQVCSDQPAAASAKTPARQVSTTSAGDQSTVTNLPRLNQGEFMGLPPDWAASFGDPDVRTAFTDFAPWITREYRPHYLGLASGINTYADAHPRLTQDDPRPACSSG